MCKAQITKKGTKRMFNGFSNDTISTALDELTTCIGVKEQVPYHHLVALLNKGDTQGCAQQIAMQLGLPVRVYLAFVTPGSAKTFRTRALAQADQTGSTTEGIIAQVSIPEYLPLFGSPSLRNYPIQVHVSKNCHKHLSTFVTVMAHELSHVLLASLSHPQKDNELYVDLVPILLGFSDVIRKGRKSYETSTSFTTTTTVTTTYGYLTDSQFNFACYYVNRTLKRCRSHKESLLEAVKQAESTFEVASRTLERFRDYFEYLDRRRPVKMKKEHAYRLVELHTHDYSIDWEIRLATLKTSIKKAKLFAQSLDCYTSKTIEHLKTHIQDLESTTRQITQITDEITEDERILRRYVGLMHRLLRILWHWL